MRSVGDSFDVNPDGLRKALENLSQFYSYIIIDIGSLFMAPQLTVMESASCSLIVTLPEVLAVNQTQKMMNQLDDVSD